MLNFWSSLWLYQFFQVGENRCVLNYRRCESGISEMLRMITLEMDQIEEIQRELNGGAINLEDIENRQIIL